MSSFAGGQPETSTVWRRIWNSVSPWQAPDATAAGLRIGLLMAIYIGVFYMCLGPVLVVVLLIALAAAVYSLGGSTHTRDLASIPVLVVIGALYLLGPAGGIAGVLLGIKGLLHGDRLRAVGAIALNGGLLLIIIFLFAAAYAFGR